MELEPAVLVVEEQVVPAELVEQQPVILQIIYQLNSTLNSFVYN